MANYTSMSQYEATTRVPSFSGLMQYGDGYNGDPRYAVEAENVDTPGGVLQPMAACTLLAATTAAKIETLAILHRRWYIGSDASDDVLIAASGGVIYYMVVGGSVWTALAHPDGGSFGSNAWSWVQYEIAPVAPATDPIDVLILSNQSDGMIYIQCDDDAKEITEVVTPHKFGVICRYNERIWGGDIATDPDMVVYSAPYDFTDWAADALIPEDGAGDIQQPTWDGDSFTALRQLGPQLIAFRKNTVWRILGTDPGEFTWKQQYGGGTAYENTIVVDRERVLMLSDSGVMQYDGLGVAPYLQEFCKAFWATLNVSALEQSCACIYKNKYYLAVPTGVSATNDAVIVFDTQERTWLLRTDMHVEAWLPSDTALYFTNVATPGRIYTWGEDAWATGAVAATPCQWASSWMDYSDKEVRIVSAELMMTVDAKSTGSLSLSIETDKRISTKPYHFDATTTNHARVPFKVHGRRFRFIIESTGTAVWRLLGGIRISTDIERE